MNTNEHPSLEQINDYVHGELPEHEDAAVHAHLAACTTCAETQEAEARLGEILREHARAEERELPLGFAQRIVDTAVASGSRPAGFLESLRASLGPRHIGIPAAAAIIVAAYVAIATSNHGGMHAATIDATAYIENHAALATDMPFAEGAMASPSFTSLSDEGSTR
jgi:anti-sigma factor RsiW